MICLSKRSFTSVGLLLSALLTAGPGRGGYAAEISYGGRLTDPSGAPVAGPIDLIVRFFTSPTGGSAVVTVPRPNVPLAEGIFQLTLDLPTSDWELLLGDGSQSLFVEVEAQGKIYPRQRFHVVPFALRVPIDSTKLRYDDLGRLTLAPNSSGLPVGPAGGDLTGAYPNPSLAATGVIAGSYVKVSVDDRGRVLAGSTTISDEDIAANTRIPDSKLATIASPGKVLASAISGGTITATLNGLATNVSGTVAIAQGGTGASTALDAFDALSPLTSPGDILVAGSAGIDTRLPGNATSTRQFLTSVGDGSHPSLPSWSPLTVADITSGVLPASLGGTGQSGSPSVGQLLIGDGVGYTRGQIVAGSNIVVGNGSGAITISATADSSKVAKAGDTMLGVLHLPADGLDIASSQLVTKGGNVGIGSATPTAKLDVLGTIRTKAKNALEVAPFGTEAGSTGEIHLQDLSGAHSVAFKSPDNLTAHVVFTLPPSTGTVGQVLTTDGSGTLSWTTDTVGSGTVTSVGLSAPTDGILVTGSAITNAGSFEIGLANDLAAIEALSTTGGVERLGPEIWSTYALTDAGKSLIGGVDAAAQRIILGLGSLATLHTVEGGLNGTIADHTITNDDIASTAAISQSKIDNLTVDLTSKEPAIAAGSPGQYWNGDKTWQILNSSAVPEAANLYFTEARARQALAATAPLAFDTNTGRFSLSQTVGIDHGGTGLSTAPANGQILIGNGTDYSLATLTAGTNISVSNGSGTITISAVHDTTKLSVAGGTMTGILHLPTDGLNAGVDQFVLAAGNVGIGTSAPSTKLDVAGDITVADKLVHSQDTNTAIRFPAGDTITAETSGAERMRITSVGNVGIGTQNPEAKFQVAGQVALVMPQTLSPTGSSLQIDFDSGNAQTLSLSSISGTLTLSFAKGVAGGTYILKIIQGPYSTNVAWPSAVKWSGGTAPTITQTNGKVDIVTLFYDGSFYYGSISQNF